MLQETEAKKRLSEAIHDRDQDKYPEALDKFDSLIKELSTSDEQWAKLMFRQSLYELCLSEKVIAKTISLAARADNYQVLADMWHNIGYISQICEDYESAYNSYDKALMYRRKFDDERGGAFTLVKMAECSVALNHIFLAKIEAREALKIFRKIGDAKMISRVEEFLKKIEKV